MVADGVGCPPTAPAAHELAAAQQGATQARAALSTERTESARLRDALSQAQAERDALRRQFEQIQSQSGAALREAQEQAAELQRQLEEERCGNLATSTTSELMRTVSGLGALSTAALPMEV